MNMFDQVSLWQDETSFGYMSKNSIEGSWDGSSPMFLQNRCTDFHSVYASFHSHQQWVSVSLTPCPHHYAGIVNDLIFIGIMQATTAAVWWSVQESYHVQKAFHTLLPLLQFTILSTFLWCFLSPRWGKVDIDNPSMSDHSQSVIRRSLSSYESLHYPLSTL